MFHRSRGQAGETTQEYNKSRQQNVIKYFALSSAVTNKLTRVFVLKMISSQLKLISDRAAADSFNSPELVTVVTY